MQKKTRNIIDIQPGLQWGLKRPKKKKTWRGGLSTGLGTDTSFENSALKIFLLKTPTFV